MELIIRFQNIPASQNNRPLTIHPILISNHYLYLAIFIMSILIPTDVLRALRKYGLKLKYALGLIY